MADIKKLVQDWLKSGKDFDQGVFILSTHSPQKILVNSLIGGEDNPNKVDKLLYELCKLADLLSEYKKRSSLIRKERKRLKETKALEKAEKIQPPAPKKASNKKNDPPVDAGGSSKAIVDEFKEVCEKTVIIIGPKNENIPFNKLPIIIQEVMKQKGSLYRDREVLQADLVKVPEDNKPDNVESRKVIVEKMDHISKRIDFLYGIQKQFQEGKITPEELVLDWDPVPPKQKPKVMDHSQLSDIELKNRQSNLRGNITKTRNMLLYQKPSKQEKANPIPAGPKEDKYLQKLEKLTFELEAIEKEIEKRK